MWVASLLGGYVTVHEQQADKTLVLAEVIQVGTHGPQFHVASGIRLGAGSMVDNLSVSPDGSVVVATFPKALDIMQGSFKNTSITAPTSAYRISINTGHDSYFGEKYKVQKVTLGPRTRLYADVTFC